MDKVTAVPAMKRETLHGKGIGVLANIRQLIVA